MQRMVPANMSAQTCTRQRGPEGKARGNPPRIFHGRAVINLLRVAALRGTQPEALGETAVLRVLLPRLLLVRPLRCAQVARAFGQLHEPHILAEREGKKLPSHRAPAQAGGDFFWQQFGGRTCQVDIAVFLPPPLLR